MVKKILIPVMIIGLLFTGCSQEKLVAVNMENSENIHGELLGKDALIYIGTYLYYDQTTRIVYWWNGVLATGYNCGITPTAYYAPNGLPYRYDPATNTLEEIE